MTLLLASCSSGVSQEDHAAVVAELVASESALGELHGELDSATEEISDLETNIDRLRTALSESEEHASELADNLEQAEANLDQVSTALEAIDSEDGGITNGSVFASVVARNRLRCGIHGSFAGFSSSADGRFAGFDVDFCRAVAAAVLGDADSVEFVLVAAGERFTAIRSGEVDVLMRNTTYTLRRDATAGEGVDFGPPIFYDGLSLMGRIDRFAIGADPSSIDGATICLMTPGHEAALASWVEPGVEFVAVEVRNLIEAVNLIEAGGCDAAAGDTSLLHATLSELSAVVARDFVVFPTIPITREPLAPAHAQGDQIWGDIVDWVVYSTIIAEQHGLASSNLTAIGEETGRLLGETEPLAILLGLPQDAFRNVIAQVGNYGEIYDRNLAPLGHRRHGSPNALFTEGGLMYAPPAR